MIRDGNSSQSDKPKYNSFAKTVISDLKLFVFRNTKKKWVQVDKNTNTIHISDSSKIQSISIEKNGCVIPLCESDEALNDEFVEIQESSCGCTTCSCSSGLCNVIKNATITEEEVKIKVPIARYIPLLYADDKTTACVDCDLPNGSLPEYEYEETVGVKKTEKYSCPNGDMKVKICEPTAIYKQINSISLLYSKDKSSACTNCSENTSKKEDYIFDGIEEVCTEDLICSLDVKPCGCPKDTSENKAKVKQHCGDTCDAEEKCCTSMKDLNIYCTDGCKIYFPDGFPHEKVLIRYYETFNYSDTTIPEFAREAVMTGIEYRMLMRKNNSITRGRLIKAEYLTEYRKVKMIVSRLQNGEVLNAILGNQNNIR